MTVEDPLTHVALAAGRGDRAALDQFIRATERDVWRTVAFLADPVNILRLFQEGLSTGTLIHPDALRLVAANLALIDDRLRNDPEANRIFLELLLGHGNPERALRRRAADSVAPDRARPPSAKRKKPNAAGRWR